MAELPPKGRTCAARLGCSGDATRQVAHRSLFLGMPQDAEVERTKDEEGHHNASGRTRTATPDRDKNTLHVKLLKRRAAADSKRQDGDAFELAPDTSVPQSLWSGMRYVAVTCSASVGGEADNLVHLIVHVTYTSGVVVSDLACVWGLGRSPSMGVFGVQGFAGVLRGLFVPRAKSR